MIIYYHNDEQPMTNCVRCEHDLEFHNIIKGGYVEVREGTHFNNIKPDDMTEHHPTKKCEKCDCVVAS